MNGWGATILAVALIALGALLYYHVVAITPFAGVILGCICVGILGLIVLICFGSVIWSLIFDRRNA